MYSTKEQVLIAGELVGEGFDVSCMIAATKVTHRLTGQVNYTRLTIQNAPSGLPDGRYVVRYHGTEQTLNKRNGFWLAAA
jgi:hypothetical protein